MANDIPAVAWAMEARSASGGKEYLTMVVNDIAVVGWGSQRSATRQYKLTRLADPQGAQNYAAAQAGLKEDKGYRLSVPPRSFYITQGEYDFLARNINSRGSLAVIDSLFRRARSELGTAL